MVEWNLNSPRYHCPGPTWKAVTLKNLAFYCFAKWTAPAQMFDNSPALKPRDVDVVSHTGQLRGDASQSWQTIIGKGDTLATVLLHDIVPDLVLCVC